MNDLSLYRILAFLPGAVRSALNRLPSGTLEKISELRLRAGNITTVTLDGENRYLTDAGHKRRRGKMCAHKRCRP